MSKLIIFDLDGTLALNEHRQHFVERPKGKKDWDSFFEACDKDEPNGPIIELCLTLHQAGYDVRIWSGRSEKVREKTSKWLDNVGLGHVPLRMRPKGDFRTDMKMQAEWLRELNNKPRIIFDDRNAMVKVWRDHGICCAQVAEGDF